MKQMDPSDPATPCGLVAKSFFNDKYSNLVLKKEDGTKENIKIDETKIAWETDLEYKFGNVEVKKEDLPEESKTRTENWFSGTINDGVDGAAKEVKPWENV